MVLEQFENSASLHGSSVANHHVCLLVKSSVSLLFIRWWYVYIGLLGPPVQGDGSLAVNAKCSDATLISNLLDEVKALL